MNKPAINTASLLPEDLGVVVIGRNEGERLAQCFRSLASCRCAVVYVDSGSTDDSVTKAREFGAEVVELDLAEPFTAAKARNAGLRLLLERHPLTQFVQFVDGDCEVAPAWLSEARQVLGEHEQVAVVCGRRRERFPDASIYSRLCDMEWDVPAGVVLACGGDAMMRVAALMEVGGYRPSMIAGEEPELCIRLRSRHWTILRIAAEMTLHDAAIARLGQWWRRSARAGHAFAEAAWLHGMKQRHVVRRFGSILFWAACVPLAAIAFAWPTRGLSLLSLPIAYLILAARVCRGQHRRGRSFPASALYSGFVVIGKFAELCGVARFAVGLIFRRRARIIEYKSPPWSPPTLPETP